MLMTNGTSGYKNPDPLSMKIPELYQVSAPSLSQNAVCEKYIYLQHLRVFGCAFVYIYVWSQMCEYVCLEAGGSTLGVITRMLSTFLLCFFFLLGVHTLT